MATLESVVETGRTSRAPREIEVPASTAWPLVLALGFTLICAGLLTSVSVSVLGAVLVVAGCAGWFREVLPKEHEVVVSVVPDDLAVITNRRVVDRLPVAPDQVRAWLPLHTHPISAGLKGGLGGGVAMAVLACAYGVLKAGSIWYPINLLAATIYSQSTKLESASLNAFHIGSFLLAVVLHLVTSLLVGLLYGAMLPMFPRRPILLGGVIGPVMWTGLLHSILGLINPLLDDRIDWRWFIASQFAFGIVAGLVVIRQERVRIRQFMPFAIRAGIESPAVAAKNHQENHRP